MKKLLTFLAIISISTSMSLAATTYGNALKNAIKKDIETQKQEAKNYNNSMKESIKKDIEAKAKASQDAKIKEAQNRKNAKLKEINGKITELNKEKASIQANKEMTYTEKTFKTRAIDKQLEFYNKQKDSLK